MVNTGMHPWLHRRLLSAKGNSEGAEPAHFPYLRPRGAPVRNLYAWQDDDWLNGCDLCDRVLIIGELFETVKVSKRGAFVAVRRASVYPVRLAVRYGYFVNPGTNALLALQGQCAGRGAVSVSDLLRNPTRAKILVAGVAASFCVGVTSAAQRNFGQRPARKPWSSPDHSARYCPCQSGVE